MVNRSNITSNFAGTAPPWLLSVLDGYINTLKATDNDSSLGWVNTGLDTGTANNYLVPTLDVGAFSGYNQGSVFVLNPANTNTGPSTLTIGSLGSVPITDQGGAPLVAGALVAGLVYGLVYLGAGFRTVSPTSVNVFIPGQVIDFAGVNAPAGWLMCNGAAVSRTTFSALYAALGGVSSPWGQGDGSSTFNVPDLRGRVSVGVGAGSGLTNRVLGASGGEENHLLSGTEMPVHNHTATATDSGHSHPYDFVTSTTPGGASVINQVTGPGSGTAILTRTGFASIAVSVANAGGNGAHNNVQPFSCLNKIIKF